MSARIAVLGASGVVGRRLLPLLTAAGHSVRAGSRSIGSDRLLAALGAQPIRADILAPASLHALVTGCDLVINLATSIPSPGRSRDWATNDRIRLDGTRHLVAACRAAAVPRLVQQSVAMLHSADDRLPQIESDPLVGYGPLASAVEMEATVRNAAFDWRIVRGALLYGTGTLQLERWFAMLRTPGFRIPGDGGAWLSLIDVDDLAAAFALVALDAAAHEIYIAADDTPLQYSTLFRELARRADLQLPQAGAALRFPSVRVTNAKLRRAGWRPARPALFESPNTHQSFTLPTTPLTGGTRP